MKKTLLFILIGLLSLQSFGQDPDLFRTWYLYSLQNTDIGYPYEISEINPPIQPFITISGDLSFNGEGACNTFNGTYQYDSPNNLLAITYNSSTEDCGIQFLNSFEYDFFGFIRFGYWYEITQESNGLTLTASNMLMGYAIFKEHPLSTSDFHLMDIKLYPNPVSDILFISTKNIVIETISVYSISGQRVLEVINETNSIDVSTLSKGIYFIEMSTETGKTVKKFIKN